MQACINDVAQVEQGQSVTSLLFPVFCICGPGMTLHFSPLMTAGNCRGKVMARLRLLSSWQAANWLGYLWLEHFVTGDAPSHLALTPGHSGAEPIITKY